MQDADIDPRNLVIAAYAQAGRNFAAGMQSLAYDESDRRHWRNQDRRAAIARRGGLRGKLARQAWIVARELHA